MQRISLSQIISRWLDDNRHKFKFNFEYVECKIILIIKYVKFVVAIVDDDSVSISELSLLHASDPKFFEKLEHSLNSAYKAMIIIDLKIYLDGMDSLKDLSDL